VPRFAFEEMATAVLGKNYQLSIVLCGDRLAQRLNKEHRKKTYYPNVLSFPIFPGEGEIFLNVRKAEREAKQFGVSAKQRIALLYVHGLFHLKGLDHGDRMEAEEQKILRKFALQ
jgi:probable rRNA maturation factor